MNLIRVCTVISERAVELNNTQEMKLLLGHDAMAVNLRVSHPLKRLHLCLSFSENYIPLIYDVKFEKSSKASSAWERNKLTCFVICKDLQFCVRKHHDNAYVECSHELHPYLVQSLHCRHQSHNIIRNSLPLSMHILHNASYPTKELDLKNPL